MIAVVTVLARLTGFARVIIFARTVGPSCLGDAYYTANTVPNIVFDVIAGGALSSLVVPVVAGPAAAGERDTVGRIVSALLTWAVAILVPIMVVGLFVSRSLVHPLVGAGHPGCPAGAEVAVGGRMLAVFMPQVVLYGIAVILIGTLQAHRRFLGPALAPLVSSVVVSAAYFTYAAVADSRETHLSTLTRAHELILSVGTTLGVAALLVPLAFPAARLGLRLRPTWQFPPGAAATVRRMALSGALVLGSQDLATAVVLRLANQRGSGGAVVIYNLAWTVFTVPWAVAAVPLATSAFPTLTAAWQAEDRSRYAATVARTSRVLLLAVAAAAAVMVATSGPASRVVILGAPGHVAPEVLARGLAAFAPGLLGYGLIALLSRALYAQGDARTPAFAALGGWLVAIGADVGLAAALPRGWTVAAFGIGTAVGVSACAAWLLLALRRTAGAAALDGLGRAGAAALGPGVLAAGCGWLLASLVHGSGVVLNLGVAIGVAAVTLAVQIGLAAVVDGPTIKLLFTRRGLRGA